MRERVAGIIVLAGAATVVEIRLMAVLALLSGRWSFDDFKRIGWGFSLYFNPFDQIVYLVLLVALAAGLLILFFGRSRATAYGLLLSIPATLALITLSGLQPPTG